jgi:opacity protein-like surface antigen
MTLVAVVAIASPARAFDPAQTFAKGTFVLSGEEGYGAQFNLEGHRSQSDLEFFNLGVRASVLPFGTSGSGPLYGALEVGLEPFYQHYTDPKPAFWAGLAAVFRYHVLGLGRIVPYAELAGAAGGTDLRVPEIDSSFSFLVWGGVGASVFLTDATAVYAGYRLEHNSNGNTSKPNRGWQSHTAVVGVSYYFR